MEIYALFDDTSSEKIDFSLLKPGSKTNVIEITYLNSVPDNQRESFDIGVKEAYFQLIDYCDNMPEKISIWFKGLSKNARGNSTDLAFALSLTVQLLDKGILSAYKDAGIISATGIINKDGQIGEVNGLKSKVIASLSIENKKHNHILFYPKANQSELENLRKDDEDFDQKIKSSGIILVPVGNLKDAFDYLCIEKLKTPESKAKKLKIALIVLPILVLGTAIACIYFYKNIYLKTNTVPKSTDLYTNRSALPSNSPEINTFSTKLNSTPTKVMKESIIAAPTVTPIVSLAFSSPKLTHTYTPIPFTDINIQGSAPASEVKLKAAVTLNRDNSLTVTFNKPVNNSIELYGAMNATNYKLINNPLPLADSKAGMAKVIELEPNFKYLITFPELITTDSFDFKLKISNVASLNNKAGFMEECYFSFKAIDTKCPSILKGPIATPFGSGWKIALSFSEPMDEESVEKLGNYALLDESKGEDFYLKDIQNVRIELLKDKKTIEIIMQDLEPYKDKLKVYFVADNSLEKNFLDKDDINSEIVIKELN